MRAGVLRGREHTRLGRVDTIAEGRLAIAISQGGARKRYAHTDPNEDAALFAEGPGGLLLAVADGHSGCEAAELAVEHLLEHAAPSWTAEAPLAPERWRDDAIERLASLNGVLVRRTLARGSEAARTTLSIAVVRPRQDLVLLASLGDSHVFEVCAVEAVDRTAAGELCSASDFLGRTPRTAEQLGEKTIVDVFTAGPARAVVLATDGLTERRVGVDDPEETVREAAEQAARERPELRPLHAARAIAQAALEAHVRNPTGDNVAVAVAWLED